MHDQIANIFGGVDDRHVAVRADDFTGISHLTTRFPVERRLVG
jgi:hypothetical protein